MNVKKAVCIIGLCREARVISFVILESSPTLLDLFRGILQTCYQSLRLLISDTRNHSSLSWLMETSLP